VVLVALDAAGVRPRVPLTRLAASLVLGLEERCLIGGELEGLLRPDPGFVTHRQMTRWARGSAPGHCVRLRTTLMPGLDVCRSG
jgi:hypothetical protein